MIETDRLLCFYMSNSSGRQWNLATGFLGILQNTDNTKMADSLKDCLPFKMLQIDLDYSHSMQVGWLRLYVGIAAYMGVQNIAVLFTEYPFSAPFWVKLWPHDDETIIQRVLYMEQSANQNQLTQVKEKALATNYVARA